MANNHLFGMWLTFSRSLQLRFGPSSYENHQASLFKLCQTTSVFVYQADFECISNYVEDHTLANLRNCFISGLCLDIQNELALHQPTMLHDTYRLAKLTKDKISNACSLFSPRYPSTPPLSLPKPTNTTITPPTAPPLLTTPPKLTNQLPSTYLSPDALQKYNAKGLCFRCPKIPHRAQM